MKARILGCGSSGGVPRLGGGWGACDPLEPRNKRSRCSLLVEADDGTTILIDTSPDLRWQLIDAGVEDLDAVFYTHVHADQAHGIDDLRGLAISKRRRIKVYGEAETMDLLTRRFDYCFQQIHDYPPILDAHWIDGPTSIGNTVVTPHTIQHGVICATGYRIGGLAYFPDVSDIGEDVLAQLSGLDVLIIDALRYRPHPSHAHVDQALAWIEQLKPSRAVLTNLHLDLDYRTLAAALPPGVEPAYDGMELRF